MNWIIMSISIAGICVLIGYFVYYAYNRSKQLTDCGQLLIKAPEPEPESAEELFNRQTDEIKAVIRKFMCNKRSVYKFRTEKAKAWKERNSVSPHFTKFKHSDGLIKGEYQHWQHSWSVATNEQKSNGDTGTLYNVDVKQVIEAIIADMNADQLAKQYKKQQQEQLEKDKANVGKFKKSICNKGRCNEQ